jgi:hypothetical protein
MDFTWVTSDDANAIQNTQLTAKGALITAFSSATPATLTVGANDSILVADSTTATGLAYKSSTTLYPWTSYTPASRSGITIGNGTESAKYLQIGKIIYVQYEFTLGSTSAIGFDAGIELPVTATSIRSNGVSRYADNGVMNYQGQIDQAGNFVYFLIGNASGTYLASSYTTSGVPFTWGTSDRLSLSMWYEVA